MRSILATILFSASVLASDPPVPARAPDPVEACRVEFTGPAGLDREGFDACVARHAARVLANAPPPKPSPAIDEANPYSAEGAPAPAASATPAEPSTAERDAAALEAEASAKLKEEALKKACGKNYHRLRVGMAWGTVARCVPMAWRATREDASGIVYEAEGSQVLVKAGTVVKWSAPE